jgi:hypothetical protein
VKLNSLPAAIVLAVTIIVAGVLIGLDKPIPAAFAATLGAIVNTLLPAVVSSTSSAATSTKVPPLPALLMAIVLVACSALPTIASVLGAISGAAPIVCTGLTIAGQANAAKVCGEVQGDVTPIATEIQNILSSLAAKNAIAKPAVAEPSVTWVVKAPSGRSVYVDGLPASVAAQVQAAAKGQ